MLYLNEINKKEEEVFKDFKKYYKNVERCKKCGVLYGYDSKTTNSLCVVHDPAFKSFKKGKRFTHQNLTKKEAKLKKHESNN